jgi:hypothetical protein
VRCRRKRRVEGKRKRKQAGKGTVGGVPQKGRIVPRRRGLRRYVLGTGWVLLSWRGRRARRFPLQRAHGKKPMAAGFAAQRGESEDSPENRGHARHARGGNALQFQVAANPAMRVQQRAKRQQAGAKSRRARPAAPRQDPRDAEEMVLHRAPFGTPAVRAVTNRAAYRAGADRLPPREE